MSSIFSKFVKKIVSDSTELEHPDEKIMDSVIKQGQDLGLTPEKSWQAYLVASEYKTLIEQEKIEGGSGKVAKNINTELLREMSYGENRK